MSGSRKLFWNKFHVVGPAKVRQPYVRIKLKPYVEQQVDGGWRNEDAVIQQLERPVYTAQTDNLVPGHASTCTPSPQACTCMWLDLPHRANAAQSEAGVSSRGRTSLMSWLRSSVTGCCGGVCIDSSVNSTGATGICLCIYKGLRTNSLFGRSNLQLELT